MDCPKCGDTAGWDGPKYGRKEFISKPPELWQEWLALTCRTCGYLRFEPTKDALPGRFETTEETVQRFCKTYLPDERGWFRRWLGMTHHGA